MGCMAFIGVAGVVHSVRLHGRSSNRAHLRKRLLMRCGDTSVATEVEEEVNEFEGLEQSDPGRSALRSEWAGGLSEIAFETDSDLSGLVRVYTAPAAAGGTWARLRFNDITDQSVALLNSDGTADRSALAFGYLKTLAVNGVCIANALGRKRPWRVLVIGAGSGALPAWFATQASATVDAVELDADVLTAATSSMGLPADVVQDAGSAADCVEHAAQADATVAGLRVYCCDGADFVRAAAEHSGGPRYDVVVVDVFDGRGKTPKAFLKDDFAAALGAISQSATVNLTCPVPMWEDANEATAPEAGALSRAWKKGFGPTSGMWSVRVPEGQNIVLGITSVGVPPAEILAGEAKVLAREGVFAFDPTRRVNFHRRDWW